MRRLGGEHLRELNNSLSFDRQLYREDLACSRAHAAGLAKIRVLSAREHKAIRQGLDQIESEIEQGRFPWSDALEDIHINIETRLTELIGDTGKKLHTGRSRNDQVATDLRLWVRGAIDRIDSLISQVQAVLLDLAENEAASPMPGFTHLQSAQPVTLGHHLMAWVEMLERDRQRLADCRIRVNVSPLGAGALAGSPYPIDRRYVARQMGFSDITRNSMDAVSDRDFAVECVFDLTLMMVHLSRMAEEIVLWCSHPFGFAVLDDAVCTGSSIMPQKKNPDIPELIRAKSGRSIGSLNALLVMLKGQPLAYNKDNQEDKEPVFDMVRTAELSLRGFAEVAAGLRFDREAMRRSASEGHSTATDLADALVREGMPFRDAYAQVRKLVAQADKLGKGLPELSEEEIRSVVPEAGADLRRALTLEASIASRRFSGGTAPMRVRAAVRIARRRLGFPKRRS